MRESKFSGGGNRGLGLDNDLLFFLVQMDDEIRERTLKTIGSLVYHAVGLGSQLPNLTGISNPEGQQNVIAATPDDIARIALDVVVDTSTTVFDLEIQRESQGNEGRRSAFQGASLMQRYNTKSGSVGKYNTKNILVVYFTTWNFRRRPINVYASFPMVGGKPDSKGKVLDNGLLYAFINYRKFKTFEDEDLKGLCSVLAGRPLQTEFAQLLVRRLDYVLSEQKWRDLAMTLEDKIAASRETWLRQGIQQGIAKGIQQGIQQGIEKGIEKGIQQGAISERQRAAKEMVERMRARGMSKEDVYGLASSMYPEYDSQIQGWLGE